VLAHVGDLAADPGAEVADRELADGEGLEDAQALGIREGPTDGGVALAIEIRRDWQVIQHVPTISVLAQTRKYAAMLPGSSAIAISRRWRFHGVVHSLPGRWSSLALIAIAAAACARAGDPVVDGWPIGPQRDCERHDDCHALLVLATAALDRRDPGHAAIVNVTLHNEGAIVDASGNTILMTRSGACCSVARFELADGTVRAIGVGYPGVSKEPIALDYGP
jgi:hypothetical protein